MKRLEVFVLLVFIVCSKAVGQVPDVIGLLDSCQLSTYSKSSEIPLPKIERGINLPANWVGEWRGENPGLFLTRTGFDKELFVDVSGAWDPYEAGELFVVLDSLALEASLYTIKGKACLLFTEEYSRYSFKILFHEDSSINTENHWTWTFGVRNSIEEIPAEGWCELKNILVQFISAYDK